MLTSAPDFTPDVFLCHNSKEKEAVRVINEILRQEYGLNTYLDESTLVSGEEWEAAIQGALARAKACAVIVGPNGWGKYQLDREARPAIRRHDCDAAFRVVPVLLPGASVDALTDLGDFFGRTQWISFQAADDAAAIRMLTYALRGENAFPEGPPRLTPSRIRFDAIRWDTGRRRDESLLYTGQELRDATALVSVPAAALVDDFLAASLSHHNEMLARQLGAHASVLWANPRRRDLAARLALESIRRAPMVEAIDVLREAFGGLQRTRGRLTHPAPVTAAARNLATSGLATGCADGSVCIWDGAVLRHLGNHPTRVHAVADLGNGRFVTGAADGTCGIWDWTNGERIAQFSAGTTVGRIDVRRQNEQTILMTCSGCAGQSGDVAIWTDAGQEVWRRGMVMQAALDASGAHVTLAWGDHVVTRRVDNGELVAKQPMNATVIDVATHPTRPMIAATTLDRRAHMIVLTGSEPERRDLGDGISRVSPIRISPDGRYVAAVRDDFRAVVWDLSDGSRRLFKYEGLMNISLEFSGDSRYLAVISPEATVITVWRLDDGQHVCAIEQDAAAVALFDDQNAMWIGSDGTTASSIELPRMDLAAATASPGLATALAYGPDGSLAWSGYAVGPDLRVAREIRLWVADPLTGATRVDATLSEAGRIAFDASGQHVAVVAGEAVRVWELTTGQEVPTPQNVFWGATSGAGEAGVADTLLASPRATDACNQRGHVATLASPDGHVVAIDHGKQLVSLWKTENATEIVSFSTTAPVAHMAFSADGTLFAAGDNRGAVMLWRADGTVLGQVKHDEPISQLAFNPTGDFLAVASVDTALRVWVASPTALARAVSARVSGGLSDEEWARYLADEPRSL